MAEVVEKFWRDPAFPIIPSEMIARRAIFDALRPDDEGVAWELATASGERLHVDSPEQLALNSPDQQLRLVQPEAEADEAPNTAAGAGTTGKGSAPTPAAESPVLRGAPVPGAPQRYVVHELELTNRSLADRSSRESLYQLLSELTDVIDPSSGQDVQVATIKVELNAAVGALDSVEAKAEQAGATWREHEEDF